MSYGSGTHAPRPPQQQPDRNPRPIFMATSSPNVEMEEETARPTLNLLGNLPTRNASNFQSMGASDIQQGLLVKPVMPIYRNVVGGRASLKRVDHLIGPNLGQGERPAIPETPTDAKSVLVREFEKAAQRLTATTILDSQTTAVREEQANINRNPKRSRKTPARFDSPG